MKNRARPSTAAASTAGSRWSRTARLGSRKWSPLFDYILHHIGLVAYDDGAPTDTARLAAFKNNMIHAAVKTCATLRPSVDISLSE